MFLRALPVQLRIDLGLPVADIEVGAEYETVTGKRRRVIAISGYGVSRKVEFEVTSRGDRGKPGLPVGTRRTWAIGQFALSVISIIETEPV